MGYLNWWTPDFWTINSICDVSTGGLEATGMPSWWKTPRLKPLFIAEEKSTQASKLA